MGCCHLLLLPTIKGVWVPDLPKLTKSRLWVSELLAWPMFSSCFGHLRSWCCWEESPQRIWWKPKGVKARGGCKGHFCFVGSVDFSGLGKNSSHAFQVAPRIIESLRLEKTLKSTSPTVNPAPPPCSPLTHVLKRHIQVLQILPGSVNLSLPWAVYSRALQTFPGRNFS